jgi:DNA-binding beta-propeller fold protein YncE
MNRYLILIIAIGLVLPIITPATAAGETNPDVVSKNTWQLSSFTAISNGISGNTAGNALCVKSTTSRGTLDVILDPSPQPVVNKDQTNFKVIFLQKGGKGIDKIQDHVDYNFTIAKEGGKKVFEATALSDEPGIPLHTAKGIVIIPYKFQETGSYLVNISVYGILFNEIRPESVEFPIQVTSETPRISNIDTNNSGNMSSTIRQPSGPIISTLQQQQQQYSFVKELGTASQYQLQYPTGVAVDSSGNVYVVDSANGTIQKFTSAGKFITKWGSHENSNSQLQYPTGVAVDSSGNVYVSVFSNSGLFNNSTIQKFTSAGKFITKWGSFGDCNGQLDHPFGIAIDHAGYVYISDHGNNRIQKFTDNGKYITKWGSRGNNSNQFDNIVGVAVDTSNNVYVVDSGNNRIQKFTDNGKYITKWGSGGASYGQFNHARGIAVDSSNNVYVVDSGNNRIQKFTDNGKYITKWGSFGDGGGKFKFADSIAIDPSGKDVYVSDLDSRSIKIFSYTS